MRRTLEPEVMDTPEEADGYDAMDHSVPNAAFVERLWELGARGGRMLDIGTGPGHIPLLVAARFPEARIVGVDLALHMLAHAERHRAVSPHGARVAFLQGNARGLDFADASFDAVFSNTILHHIPDPVPFLREARRVLRPGGALLIRDLYRPPTPERALELVALHAAGETPSNRELLRASLHAALTVEELRAAAAEAGLGDAELVVDTDRHVSLQRRAAPAGARRG
jgi:ubiquinone/menaquinone biosynthesis C-methylase UbiE